jgi:hypothetical protein
MNSDLKNRIYSAQCFGNIEPVEFMVPYPNIFSLVEGQNVKYRDALLYKDLSITNKEFLDLTNRAASWLTSIGGKPESRILLPSLPFPYSEIMAFGIWNLGGTVVLINDKNPPKRKDFEYLNLVSSKVDIQRELSKSNPNFIPKFRSNLLDEAMIFLENNNGIQLSHYSLLVNANGVKTALGLKRGSSIKTNISPNTIAWVILQAILPFYTGTAITHKKADTTFSLPGQFQNPDYLIQPEWDSIEKTDPPTLYLLSENGGILTINDNPIHLTDFKTDNKKLVISGHSVMMGYVDDAKNETCFRENSLIIDNTF